MQILLVEDDVTIAFGLSYSLTSEGYGVTVCHTAAEARHALLEQPFSLCLFDLSLPDGSGYDLCVLAKQKQDTPVIFLTAFDDEPNVVKGLDLGADDYVSKPFRLRELLSRIRSVLRRAGKSDASPVLLLGEVCIHTLEAKVTKRNAEIPLTALEYRLLLTLAGRPNQLMTRAQILEGIWDVAGDFVNDNTLTVISNACGKSWRIPRPTPS